jgi:hypothetical protein
MTLDQATAKWSIAKVRYDKAKQAFRDNRASEWHRHKLDSALKDFNLACIDRQYAREAHGSTLHAQ